ncbi:MAG: DUF4363 family protein [Sarcina sp.]
MKKNIFIIILFTSLVVTVFISSKKLTTTCNNIIAKCDTIEMLFFELNSTSNQSDTLERIFDNILELDEYINSKYTCFSLCLTHECIELLKTNSYSLIQYVKSGQTDDISCFLSSIKRESENIILMQKVNLENII